MTPLLGWAGDREWELLGTRAVGQHLLCLQVGRCGYQELQSSGRPQDPGSGGFTLGLDVSLGSPEH